MVKRMINRAGLAIAGVTGFIGASAIPSFATGWDVSSITFDAAPVQTLGLGVLGALALIFIVKKAAGFLGSRG